MEVQVERLPGFDDVDFPTAETDGSAGLDLRAAIRASVTLPPLGRERIGTGIRLALPPGFEGQVRPRSGLAARHGVTVLNSPGTVDSDYRGEVQVVLVNLGSEPYTIRRGDRIAQLVVSSVAKVELRIVDSLGGTSRGSGGFGHSGYR